MKNPKKILIIVQRSNGDVFLTASLINSLYNHYQYPQIDILVNDDTSATAKILPHINFIYEFSYSKKNHNQLKQEINLIRLIYKKYDLSINLTASDRSIIYSLMAGRISISAVEKEIHKSWWKKLFLNHYYFFDSAKHILLNNLMPLSLLKINYENIQDSIGIESIDNSNIKSKLSKKKIAKFIIFHPSAQYEYKVYPRKLRDKLLNHLNSLEIPIIITGGDNKIDLRIKKEIPQLKNIYNLIGETSLSDYVILSELAMAYIGMDTLNMHIAASQNKRIFAIFGSTKLSMWSPWSNQLKKSASINKPIQTYGKNTIFQAQIPCKVCGISGCGNNHGKNEFPEGVDPKKVFNEIENWYQKNIS